MKFCNVIISVCVLFAVSDAFRADAMCSPPPTGLWLIQTYEPPNSFLKPVLSGYLHLEKDTDNPEVFIGIAPSRPRFLTEYITFVAQLTALFDYETCSLHGAFIYPSTTVHDTFNWVYKGGDAMVGLYSPLLSSFPEFKQSCLMMLQYQGPRRKERSQ